MHAYQLLFGLLIVTNGAYSQNPGSIKKSEIGLAGILAIPRYDIKTLGRG